MRAETESELMSIEQKNRLVAQLRTQSVRLTKAIVADEYLLDFEFVMCPRCGSEVSMDRSTDDHCYLCLQEPHVRSVGREDLAKEQERLEQQIEETLELIRAHEERTHDLRSRLEGMEGSRRDLARELNFRTRTFVSHQASAIAEQTRIRTELREQLTRLTEYLSLFDKHEIAAAKVRELEEEQGQLEVAIDAASSSTMNFEEHISYLEEQFRIALERFHVPHFLNTGYTGIDRRTYRPIVEGRPFEELQSPGFVTLVNIAHAIAHQVTAIERNLALPNILIIDGVSNNLGTEGLDRERVNAVYEYLIELDSNYGDRLQMIVADNTVPREVHDHVRVRLSEEDKLIPADRLG